MKHMRRFTALVLALVMVFSLTAPASAAQPKAEQVNASISYNITVTFNGEAKALSNVNGQQVYPILCGGTTYVPIRAIGYLLGLKVDWDQATRTMLLNTPGDGDTIDIKTALPDIPRKTGTEAVTPTIDPGITVKYDGAVQEMKTAKGETVYPMLLGGTTYLPIRAVGNMLGLDVDWDQATQTVKLANSSKAVIVTSKGSVTIDLNTFKNDRLAVDDQLAAIGIAVNSDEYQDAIMKIVYKAGEYEQAMLTATNDTVVTDTGASNQYLAVDWSTANKGYINVKMKDSPHEKLGSNFSIMWVNEKGQTRSEGYELFPGQEYDVPLEGGSTEYSVSFTGTNWLTTSDQKIHTITARFTAEIDDPNDRWLASVQKVNFKSAPNTCAKALELTKNCKTDAEKITAVFNWVSQNIKYDHKMAEDNDETGNHHDLDKVLADKSGICEHYAILMAGMLRSVGIPCKVVGGKINNKGNWNSHAWVAVKPETGTLNIPGSGKDYADYTVNDDYNSTTPTEPTGWVRLDPTNARVPNFTSNDANYRTERYY